MNRIYVLIFLIITIRGSGQLVSSTEHTSSSEDYFNFYQKNISDLRGASCPMYPSCANYTLETIKEAGLVKGIINGSDRLLRCGHEHKYYNLTLQEKGFRLLDLPLEGSDLTLRFKTNKPIFSSYISNSDSVINEITLLVNAGYISEAIILINRYKAVNKLSNPDIVELEFVCLNVKKEYEKVMYLFDLLDSTLQNKPSILKQYYISCFSLENFNAIIKQSRNSIAISSSDPVAGKQLNKYPFVSLLKKENIDEAEVFSKTNLEENDRTNALNTISLLRNIKQKSPEFATALSIIIPGAGYVYAGHFTTGLSALIINSLIGYASYTSFKSGNSGIGVLTGIVGLGFYIGNIQGTSKSIKRERDYNKNKIIKDFMNQSFIN